MKERHIQVVRNEVNPVIPPRPDFDALALKAKATMVKPLWKQPWFYGGGGLAVIGVVAGLVWMNTQKINPKNNKKHEVKTTQIMPAKTVQPTADTTPIHSKKAEEQLKTVAVEKVPVMTQIQVPENNNAASKSLPPAPRMKSPKGFTFTVEEPNIPELAIYENVVFEVLPGQNFDPKAIPDYWDYIAITKTSTYGVYVLTLMDTHQTLKYKAIPVFLNVDDYNKALAAYQKETRKIGAPK